MEEEGEAKDDEKEEVEQASKQNLKKSFPGERLSWPGRQIDCEEDASVQTGLNLVKCNFNNQLSSLS